MNQFEELVDAYNQPLYRFALSLVRDLDRAVDLVTRTFVIWSLRQGEGVKCVKANEGLFSTLYREHLGRFGSRVDNVGKAMLSPAVVAKVPGDLVEPLGSLDADLLPALTLFYLQRHNYREIATILDLPIVADLLQHVASSIVVESSAIWRKLLCLFLRRFCSLVILNIDS